MQETRDSLDNEVSHDGDKAAAGTDDHGGPADTARPQCPASLTTVVTPRTKSRRWSSHARDQAEEMQEILCQIDRRRYSSVSEEQADDAWERRREQSA